MYKQSRSKRWLGVLREQLAILQSAEESFAAFAEAAKHQQGVRVIGERDREVMTSTARDQIKLTLQSQNLGGETHLAKTLDPVAQAVRDLSFGDGFDETLRTLINSIENALPLLEVQMAADDSIDEIIGELERAFLISLVVTLTSHNVLIQKVAGWEGPHQRFLQGYLPTDVGHYFDVKTLDYAETGGPGRVHMQDLVSAINGGAVIMVAAARPKTVESYPEVQAVSYAQWFSYAYSLWEEQFRGRIAKCFDRQAETKVRSNDVLNDFFGDIRLIRNDFVHNKGVCKESAAVKILKWVERGKPMHITAEQMMSLIDLFPRDELIVPPSTRQPSGPPTKIPGKVDPQLLEDVQQRGRELQLTDDELAQAVLSAWLAANSGS
ncbi:hypothetical protein [Mycolicibacterium sp. YH-1]|uniref:hypothetical protein n=1 Tax=Mycolicibacterium sp. YH-1 TaxID=2908837 RepID=UPI001F4C186B|nr:hypothetical protein [Mycolicibacterium sp. YH-1]UNB55480.1 hypothetical protein L0M16_14905 [Mycolicibacterium sp. YH-1]